MTALVIDGQVPSGRYAILINGVRMLVKLNRVSAPRRYTSIYVALPGDDVWGEVVVPGTRSALLDRLREVDLGTAAHLYACITRKCGICYRPVQFKPHYRCIERRYGELGLTDGT